jgi:MYND finger
MQVDDLVIEHLSAAVEHSDVLVRKGQKEFEKRGKGAFYCFFRSITGATRVLRSDAAQKFSFIPSSTCGEWFGREVAAALEHYDPQKSAVIICSVQISKKRADQLTLPAALLRLAVLNDDDNLQMRHEEQRRKPPDFFNTEGCAATGCEHNENLKACSSCNDALYCSKTCQRSDWPVHKNECKEIKAIKTYAKQGIVSQDVVVIGPQT